LSSAELKGGGKRTAAGKEKRTQIALLVFIVKEMTRLGKKTLIRTRAGGEIVAGN